MHQEVAPHYEPDTAQALITPLGSLAGRRMFLEGPQSRHFIGREAGIRNPEDNSGTADKVVAEYADQTDRKALDAYAVRVTDNAYHEEALRETANRDSLTGLANKRTWRRMLRGMMKLAEETDGEVGILLFDVDAFKELNDVHGHPVGDEVLIRIARILEGNTRWAENAPAPDLKALKEVVNYMWSIPGRLGGDEFALAVFFPKNPQPKHAYDKRGREEMSTDDRMIRIVQRLTGLVAEEVQGYDITRLGISVGRAIWTEDTTETDLLTIADRDLANVKRRGKLKQLQHMTEIQLEFLRMGVKFLHLAGITIDSRVMLDPTEVNETFDA